MLSILPDLGLGCLDARTPKTGRAHANYFARLHATNFPWFLVEIFFFWGFCHLLEFAIHLAQYFHFGGKNVLKPKNWTICWRIQTRQKMTSNALIITEFRDMYGMFCYVLFMLAVFCWPAVAAVAESSFFLGVSVVWRKRLGIWTMEGSFKLHRKKYQWLNKVVWKFAGSALLTEFICSSLASIILGFSIMACT